VTPEQRKALQAAALRRAQQRQAKGGLGAAIYENVVGKGEIDTPGERLGAGIRDVGQSLATGVGRGVANLAALPGAATSVADAAVERLTGVDVEPSMAERTGTLAQTLYSDTGMGQYEPQTRAGKYAGTVGEFLPGVALGGTVAQMVASGTASEFAGQMTEGTDAEPWARLAGAILGAPAANLAGKGLRAAVSPNAPAPQNKLAAGAQLADEGVQTTAGQRTGNRQLLFDEEQLGRTAQTLGDQGEQFTRAVMRRLGVDGLATPGNLRRATNDIGGVFRDIAKGRNIAIGDDLLAQADEAVKLYDESVGTVAKMPENIVKALRRGEISGKLYNDFASRLGKLKTSNDGATREVATSLRAVLDDALARSVPAADAARLAKARTQYRDLLAIEKAVTGAGEDAASSIVTPARLRTAVAGQGRRAYAQGGRDLGEVAKAGVIGMPQPNTSGTAERVGAKLARQLGPLASGTGLGTTVGGAIGGYPGALAGAGIGMMAPTVRNQFIQSRLGQSYLANQMMPVAPQTGGNALTPALMGIANR